MSGLKGKFWQTQWDAFAASFDPDEARKASGPGAIAFVMITFSAVVLIPAYVEPLASAVEFRFPFLPVLVMAVASGISLLGWRKQIRGPLGITSTFLDTTLSLAAFQIAAVLTAPPASYAYALVAGLVVLASQSRIYGLTLVFGLAVCVPLGLIPIVFLADAPLLIIAFSSCVLALWSSNMTRTANLLRQQNLRLRGALATADEIVDHNRQIVLAGLLLDVGYFVHEVRNAQSVIAINIAYLMENRPMGNELEECLRDLKASNLQLQKVCGDALEMVKNRSFDESSTLCVREALGKIPREAYGTRVNQVGKVAAMLVQGLERDLIGALSQLIRNAGQAGSSQVVITTKPSSAGAAIEITVDDDGPGIPKSRWGDLFKPFQKERTSKGLGLGLYLVQKRIELMGGRIHIGESPMGGARFVVLLPAKPALDPPSKKEVRECSTTTTPQLG